MSKTIALVEKAQMSAVGYYRVHQPFSQLRRNQLSDYDIYPTEKSLTTKDLLYCDAVFMKRPNTAQDRELLKQAKKMGVKIILDFDDNLLSIPPTNPSFAILMQTLDNVKAACELADLIFFSTEGCRDHFKDKLSLDADRCVVVKNAILGDLPEQANRLEDKVIVAWRGGSSHHGDIEQGRNLIHGLCQHPKIKTYFYGMLPAIAQGTDVNFISWIKDVYAYKEAYRSRKPNVHIVPLRRDEFNSGKSNIAYLEAAQAGAITAASFIGPEFNRESIIRIGPGSEDQDKLVKKIGSITQQQIDHFFALTRKDILENYQLTVENDKRAKAIKGLWM